MLGSKSANAANAATAITGAILAGGQSRRMGQDKATTRLGQSTLIDEVAQNLRPQVAELLVVGNVAAAQRVNAKNVSDAVRGGLGPLAGIAGALMSSSTHYVLIASCDVLGLPSDVAQRLLADSGDAMAAVPAWRGEQQPLPCLLKACVLEGLNETLARRELALQPWLASLKPAVVEFNVSASDIYNLNTPEAILAYLDTH